MCVKADKAFSIIITRSGFMRPHANYNYLLTNNSGRVIANSVNARVGDFLNIRAGQANIGDILTLTITQIADTVDYLDIIIGGFSHKTFRLENSAEINKASSISLPGASKKAITTGAVLLSNYNVRDEISPMSGWGPIPRDVDDMGLEVVPYTIKPELCAPSEGGATSPTAPRVSGALAVLASAGKIDLSKPNEVKQILLKSHVIQIGRNVNNTFGYGRLYLDADIDWPPPTPKPPVPVDPDNKNV